MNFYPVSTSYQILLAQLAFLCMTAFLQALEEQLSSPYCEELSFEERLILQLPQTSWPTKALNLIIVGPLGWK